MVRVVRWSPFAHPVQRGSRLIEGLSQREDELALIEDNSPRHMRPAELWRERAAHVSKVKCDEVRKIPDEIFVMPVGPRSHLVPCKDPHKHHWIPLPVVHLLRGGRTVSHTTAEWQQLACELLVERLTPA